MNDDIHSCSYYCDRPACIKAQRDELVRKYVEAPTAERVKIPAGMMLVPIIPTAEMDAAGKDALSDNGVDDVDTCDALVWLRRHAPRLTQGRP